MMVKVEQPERRSDIQGVRRRVRRYALFQLLVLAGAVATGLGGYVLVAASGAVLGAVFALWAGLACLGPLLKVAMEFDGIPAAFAPIRKLEYERLWERAVRSPELREKVEGILSERDAITRYEYRRLMGDEDPDTLLFP
ncbi:hypothetical protein [Thiohalorhabdus methylotrophus]|uniref:Uncharacterized protein n=1 Tax=Thiohalorhabdus methylotrophus TaxID=3242694 RepID=A0ABV4TUZ0_9GAMM